MAYGRVPPQGGAAVRHSFFTPARRGGAGGGQGEEEGMGHVVWHAAVPYKSLTHSLTSAAQPEGCMGGDNPFPARSHVIRTCHGREDSVRFAAVVDASSLESMLCESPTHVCPAARLQALASWCLVRVPGRHLQPASIGSFDLT